MSHFQLPFHVSSTLWSSLAARQGVQSASAPTMGTAGEERTIRGKLTGLLCGRTVQLLETSKGVCWNLSKTYQLASASLNPCTHYQAQQRNSTFVKLQVEKREKEDDKLDQDEMGRIAMNFKPLKQKRTKRPRAYRLMGLAHKLQHQFYYQDLDQDSPYKSVKQV